MSARSGGELERAVELAARFDTSQDPAASAPGTPSSRIVHEARELLERTGRRRTLAPGWTVVALLGATGSGKSSLFNALTGTRAARTSVTRPTTSEPLAAVAGPAQQCSDPAELLDWLGVTARLEIDDGPLAPGTIVLDLPDIDSDDPEHRRTAEAMAGLVDVLVWVLDPEKYADGVVHHDFLVPMATHGAVMLVVLNQVDRLSPEDRDPVMTDLRNLLEAEGLGTTEVIAASVRTGQGVEALGRRIGVLAGLGRAAEARLAADRRRTARELRLALGVGEPQSAPATGPVEELREAAARAGGVEQVVRAVRRSTELATTRRLGWPPVRWLGRLRSDPLRLLHLGRTPPAQDPTAPVAVTSVAPPGPQAVGALRVAAHRAAHAMTAGMPEPVRAEMVARTCARAEGLTPVLDEAVARTDLGGSREPRWWAVVDTVHLVLVLSAAVGGLWQAALVLARTYLLIDLDPPRWGVVPWPVVLLVGSAAAGLGLALACSWLARAGARRRARRVEQRLRAATDAVVERELEEPLRAAGADWQELAGLLAALERSG
ncbi:GTPase [Actinomyces howellii]|uniref:tRNA modification GTPase TrmE n=1 Tax=Actinomyces howellii TaxID=52771 RepID=A0A3S4SLF7_9ACTO|nr:GTPase [Actinomyces howellii]VEG25974.1 tRNA modification GTPase TrmE [Actinomyces howellii]